MRSDDVKRMLETAAAEPSRPLDTQALVARGRRLRRGRFAAVAAGLVVVLAGASTTFGVIGKGPSDKGLGPAGESREECGPRTHATIFLRKKVAGAEIERLAADLERNPDVVHLEFVSREQARSSYLTAYEDLAAGVAVPPANAWPDSFRVEVVDETALEEMAYTTDPSIERVVMDPLGEHDRCLQRQLCDRPVPLEVSIFLRKGATSAQIEALRESLAQNGDVEKFHFFSKEEALHEFEQLSGAPDDPFEVPPPGAIPASSRVTAVDEEATHRIEALFVGAPVVDAVKYGGMPQLSCPEAPEPEGPGPDPVVEIVLLRADCDVSGNFAGTVPEGKWCRFGLRVDNDGDRPVTLEVGDQVLHTDAGRIPPWAEAMQDYFPSQLFVREIPARSGRIGEAVFLLSADQVPERLELHVAGTDAPVTFDLDYGCPADLRDARESRCLFKPEKDTAAPGVPAHEGP